MVFTCDAPDAQAVFVTGTFSNWEPNALPLKRDAAGLWKRTQNLPPGRYEYRLMVDGEWCNDPNAECCPNEFGEHNCVLEVPDQPNRAARA